MWGISILANFRPMSFYFVVVFGLGKDLLFKSVLGHCVQFLFSIENMHSMKMHCLKLNPKQKCGKSDQKNAFYAICSLQFAFTIELVKDLQSIRYSLLNKRLILIEIF